MQIARLKANRNQIPLTLALSQRERERQRADSHNGQVVVGGGRLPIIPPLPPGEGRGEGNSQTHADPIEVFCNWLPKSEIPNPSS
jgi:hypothetical protein